MLVLEDETKQNMQQSTEYDDEDEDGEHVIDVMNKEDEEDEDDKHIQQSTKHDDKDD